MSTAGQTPTDREQAALQCRAVAHMAKVLAELHSEQAALFADARNTGPDHIASMVGERTSALMETLGNILNGMDAVTEDDDWIAPIFAEAQRRWPVRKTGA